MKEYYAVQHSRSRMTILDMNERVRVIFSYKKSREHIKEINLLEC